MAKPPEGPLRPHEVKRLVDEILARHLPGYVPPPPSPEEGDLMEAPPKAGAVRLE